MHLELLLIELIEFNAHVFVNVLECSVVVVVLIVLNTYFDAARLRRARMTPIGHCEAAAK